MSKKSTDSYEKSAPSVSNKNAADAAAKKEKPGFDKTAHARVKAPTVHEIDPKREKHKPLVAAIDEYLVDGGPVTKLRPGKYQKIRFGRARPGGMTGGDADGVRSSASKRWNSKSAAADAATERASKEWLRTQKSNGASGDWQGIEGGRLSHHRQKLAKQQQDRSAQPPRKRRKGRKPRSVLDFSKPLSTTVPTDEKGNVEAAIEYAEKEYRRQLRKVTALQRAGQRGHEQENQLVKTRR